MAPTQVPKATAARVASIAIRSEVRAPWMSPANRLRPSESVPKKNSPNGGENGLVTMAKGLVGASNGAAKATATMKVSHARLSTTRGLLKKRRQKLCISRP
jgi:hypothetical protein